MKTKINGRGACGSAAQTPYQSPAAKVVQVDVRTLLCLSPGYGGFDEEEYLGNSED